MGLHLPPPSISSLNLSGFYQGFQSFQSFVSAMRGVTSPVAAASAERTALLAQLDKAFAAQNTQHSTLETLREGALEIRRLLAQFKTLEQPLTLEEGRALLEVSFFNGEVGTVVALAKPRASEAQEMQTRWAVQNEARRDLCDALIVPASRGEADAMACIHSRS
ncbi:MAG: hypothetical protein V4623_09035 [Pseudomonadota bacterium]